MVATVQARRSFDDPAWIPPPAAPTEGATTQRRSPTGAPDCLTAT